MLLHQPDCPFFYFRGKLIVFLHDSILSKVRASSKPGAIHTENHMTMLAADPDRVMSYFQDSKVKYAA
jgi:hypothetical protein